MPKPQRWCVFCEGPHLDREHFWPDWASEMLQKGKENREVVSKFIEINKLAEPPVEMVRQGAMTTKRIKAVCKKCNSGWMSILEKKAKPTLTKLLAAESFLLTSSQISVLSEWITLKVIVGESRHREDAAILPMERKEFYETRTIPKGLQIWISRCEAPEWQTRYYRNAVTLADTPVHVQNTLAKNTQSTTFGFGNLFVHTMYTNLPNLGLRFQFLPLGIVYRIWPDFENDIEWPPMPLPSLAAWDIAQTLNKMILDARFIYVP